MYKAIVFMCLRSGKNISLLNLIITAYIWLIYQWAGDSWMCDKDLCNLGIMYLFHKIIFLTLFQQNH